MVTRADLGLMRLVAQRVAGPSPGGPTDVVAWLVAAQAQDLLGALESIALRTAEGHVDDVRSAFDAGKVIRTWPMRGTLHAVRADDASWLTEHRPAASDVHLLPGFDEIVLGYADRSATIPPEHASRVVPGGNGVFRGSVLHEGVAVGTWRWTGTGRNRRRTAEPFTSFAPAVTSPRAFPPSSRANAGRTPRFTARICT